MEQNDTSANITNTKDDAGAACGVPESRAAARDHDVACLHPVPGGGHCGV